MPDVPATAAAPPRGVVSPRPRMGGRSPAELTGHPAKAQPPTTRDVGAETANALLTEAPLSTDELTLLQRHYHALAALCEVSGPRFSNARRDAVDMHNRAVRRLRGIRDEAKRRAALADEEDLIEIS